MNINTENESEEGIKLSYSILYNLKAHISIKYIIFRLKIIEIKLLNFFYNSNIKLKYLEYNHKF